MKNIRSLFAAVSLMGICSATYASQIFDTNFNGSRATAINLDLAFSLDAHGHIFNSTTVAHATATRNVFGNVQYDWFSFTATAGKSVVMDIDNGIYDLDAVLTVYNSGGSAFLGNNNAFSADPGSVDSRDPFLQMFASYTGLYFVQVSTNFGAPIDFFDDYDLHISVQDHAIFSGSSVPDMASTLSLFGLALVGLAAFRANSKKAVSV